MILLRFCLVFIISLGFAVDAWSQYYSVQIYVEQAYISGYNGDEYGPRIRFYRDQWNDNWPYKLWGNGNCIKLGNGNDMFHWIGKSYSTSSSSSVFDLVVVTHEERKSGSDDCTSQGTSDVSTKHPDRFQTSTNVTINLNDYTPGVYSPTIVAVTQVEWTYVETHFRIRYYPVPLIPPTGPGGNHCSNEDFTISTANSPSYTSNATGLQYDWEYHISGDVEYNPQYSDCLNECYRQYSDCYQFGGMDCDMYYNSCVENCDYSYEPFIDRWVPLGTTSGPSLTFNPLNQIFGGMLTSTTEVQFRAKPKAGWDGYAGAAGLQGSFSSPSNYFSFTPPPPSSTSTPVPERSCSVSATGVITLNNISSVFGSYRYILKRGDVTTLGCNPDAGECFDVEKSGQHTGSQLILSDIPPGTYSLFLLNNGGAEGVCPRRIGGAIVVDPVTNLDLSTFAPANITCHGTNNGSVAMTITGGRSSTVSYTLVNALAGYNTSQNSTTANASVSFGALPPGAFSLEIEDGCTPKVSRNFTLYQPVKVDTVEFQRVPSTCNDPGNGTVKVEVFRSSGTYDQSASTLFQYELFKDGQSYSLQESSDPIYTWLQNLPPSNNYQLVVTEKGSETCNGYSGTFIIGGNALLEFASLEADSVSCFEGDDGVITALGKGGIGNYTYSVSGITDPNTTGHFPGLRANSYSVTVKNNNPSCNDSYTQVIEVKEPTRLTAVLTAQDISCFGKGDGKVTSVVGGGNEGDGYVYTWETQFNGNWVQMGITETSLDNLEEGDFRLRVTDDKTCPALSNEVRVTEPKVISLSHVDVVDIKCFGEKGNINVGATGGVEPYTFEYTTNGTNYTVFTSSTPLDVGSYRVKVTDTNGCPDQHPEVHTLTHPEQPLQFTAVLSDYNGFNISCYGGNNGTATFSAEGGNGAHYNGYEYAVDDGAYQSDITVSGIMAGNRVLKVRDNRGCVVTEDIVFTQTAERLQTALVEKKDVACDGDNTGILEIMGTGGLGPYYYSLDGTTFLDQGRFTGLASGPYTIVVKDRNNCDSNYENEIFITNPTITTESTVKDVSCYGGNDGTITTVVTDGVSPFQYEWSGVSSNAPAVSGLQKGTYVVKVTDNAGCVKEFAVEVGQPEKPLAIWLNTVPVCYGRTNGIITAYVTGGTQPYQYSLDNGQHYQAEPVFLRGVGDYTVKSVDSQGCLVTATTTIIQRNDRPEPNFLVATKYNALDTLVITDISVPKPDSIYWVFDPNATVVNADQWSPQILFDNAGTYFVSMTGYFGGCDYAVTKNMTVSPYDPGKESEKVPGYKPIQSLSVNPNPSTGAFEVTMKLNKAYDVSVVVYDMLGITHYSGNWQGVEEVKQPIVLNNAAAGVYLVRAITGSDAQEVRVLINK